MVSLDEYIIEKNIKKIHFLKIDTEGSEFDVLIGAEEFLQKIHFIIFEHHYHDMLKKNCTLSDIHNYLVKNGFEKKLKIKMFFRKSFEYIYANKSI